MTDFDPLCEFLLKGNRNSLFERASAIEELTYRCKGCRKLLPSWQRMEHGAAHVVEMEREKDVRRAEVTAARVENMARARAARRDRAA